MSRVFDSGASGATVYVFAHDHCPPHVHARHRGEGWVVRAGFSYVTGLVQAISIVPVRSVPARRAVGGLLDDIRAELAACRRIWWAMHGTACLENRWTTLQNDALELLPSQAPGAVQVGAARYDPDQERLYIALQDGRVVALRAGEGMER